MRGAGRRAHLGGGRDGEPARHALARVHVEHPAGALAEGLEGAQPPSRVHLALLAVVVSLAGGVLAAMLVDLLSPTVDDMAALRALTERATLGAVTVFHTPEARRHELTTAAGQGLALVVLLSAQAAWIGWLASTPGLN